MSVDLYFIGFLGNKGHGGPKWIRPGFCYPVSVEDGRLRQSMDTVRPWSRYFRIEANSECPTLKRLEEDSNVKSSPCPTKATGWRYKFDPQIMFINFLIRMAMQSGTQYRYYVRLRPDVRLSVHVPWKLLDDTKVTVRPRHYGCGDDWLFVLGGRIIETYWKTVSDYYYGGQFRAGTPDHNIFPRWNCMSEYCTTIRPFMSPLGKVFVPFPLRLVSDEFMNCTR